MSLKKDIISAEVQIGSNEAQASLVKLAQHTASLTNLYFGGDNIFFQTHCSNGFL